MNKFVNRNVLRMSEIYAPTLKEDPSDADIVSAKLLARAGMIRKEAAGLYTFLPLGLRVIHKIEKHRPRRDGFSRRPGSAHALRSAR